MLTARETAQTREYGRPVGPLRGENVRFDKLNTRFDIVKLEPHECRSQINAS
jgi:hypothetical protein